MLSEIAEPQWVAIEALIDFNPATIAEMSEPHAVLNPGLLESAWAKPINRWAYEGECDLVRLAEAGISFLGANGATLDEAIDSASLADAFVSLIEHVITEGEFAERLRPHVRPLD